MLNVAAVVVGLALATATGPTWTIVLDSMITAHAVARSSTTSASSHEPSACWFRTSVRATPLIGSPASVSLWYQSIEMGPLVKCVTGGIARRIAFAVANMPYSRFTLTRTFQLRAMNALASMKRGSLLGTPFITNCTQPDGVVFIPASQAKLCGPV